MSQLILKKIANNFGSGAIRALGLPGYARYLASAISNLRGILASRDLRAIDQHANGVVTLRHPVSETRLLIDTNAYRAIDVEEGSYVFGLLRELWFRNVYFREFDIPDRLAGVVDLGANRGIFTLLAAAIAEHVVAVEAQEKYRLPMQRNLDINNLANTTIINGFVGGVGSFEAPGARIDLSEVFASLEGRPVDFLKIDIEGSEFGLKLDQFVSVKRVAMELHREWGDAANMARRIRDSGFDCRTYDAALRPIAAEDAAFLCAINRRFSDVRWADGNLM